MSKKTNKQIEQRLRIMMGHTNALIDMLENERDYKEIFLQVKALKGSIGGVETLLIEDYLKECTDSLSKNSKEMITFIIKNHK